MTANLSRRAVTLALASMPVAARAEQMATDMPLRRLWADYQRLDAEYKEARDRHHEARAAMIDEPDWLGPDDIPEKVRAVFHEQCDAAYRDGEPLRLLSDAWNVAGRRLIEARATIYETPAEGPFGLAVKLAANHDDDQEEDFEERIAIVLADVERLTGETFPGADPEVRRWWGKEDEDEAA